MKCEDPTKCVHYLSLLREKDKRRALEDQNYALRFELRAIRKKRGSDTEALEKKP